jgi:hypothetical protein
VARIVHLQVCRILMNSFSIHMQEKHMPILHSNISEIIA